ncbi:MAG: hypothetical protein K5665_05380 [Saccharofermentans sp.]|nr:hypothetical protein [Saccharofermentans sp.]
MFVNGYIIQKYVDNGYKGVDGSGFSADSGENWYLNSVEGYSEEFEPYFDKEICKDEWYFEPHTYVGVCTDLEYIKRYISVSKKLGIKYRVLVVMTDIPSPTVELDPSMDLKFLGFDYAYECPDNYSAVYNEVPFVFPECKLNENGLFETREELDEYLLLREKFVDTHPPYTLEAGNFTVFKVYELNI